MRGLANSLLMGTTSFLEEPMERCDSGRLRAEEKFAYSAATPDLLPDALSLPTAGQ